MAVALSAVLQTATPIRPFGRSTRYASLATVSGFVKTWNPNRLVTRSNDSSGKSSVSASIARNVSPGIRRSSAIRVASWTISSERSMPTTRPSGPTMRAMLIAGSPGPVARSSADSRIFGLTRANRSKPYGSKSRRSLRYFPAAAFHAVRVCCFQDSSEDCDGVITSPSRGRIALFASGSQLEGFGSQPPFSMHPPGEDRGRDSHQQQRKIQPFRRVEPEERHVHPERARDDGDGQGDREDDREDFDHLVGLVRHEGRLDLHQAPHDLSIRIERVQDADHVVLNVPQIVPHLFSEDRDLEAAQD